MRPSFVNASRSLATALILVSSIGLSGCFVEAVVNDNQDDVFIETTRDHYLPGDAVSVTITNSGNERLLLTTCGSQLEREVNGSWVRVVYDLGNFGCPDVLLPVDRHESRTFPVDILSPNRRLPSDLASGRYRIVLPELREEGSGDSYLKSNRRSDSFTVN